MNYQRIFVISLSGMILWDLSLHILEFTTGILFPIFPSREIYTSFWIVYWFVALIIACSLLFARWGRK